MDKELELAAYVHALSAQGTNNKGGWGLCVVDRHPQCSGSALLD